MSDDKLINSYKVLPKELETIQHKMAPKIIQDKTIYDVKNIREDFVKKIIDLEVEQHAKQFPDHVFSGIKVVSKENGSVTYQLEYTHRKLMRHATSRS
jgi:hypothetical protein